MKKRGLKRYYRNLFKKNFAEKIIAELKAEMRNTTMSISIWTDIR